MSENTGGAKKSGAKETFGVAKKAFNDSKSSNNQNSGQVDDNQEEAGSVQDTAKSSGKGKDGAKKAKDAAKRGKKFFDGLKSIQSLAPLVSALSTIAIALLIIFLIIGFIGFFTTLPGLAMEKFCENASSFLKWLLGSEKIDVSDEQITDLANYIQELGYSLEGCGFVKVGKVKREDTQDKNKVTSVEWDKKNSLYAYILQNERTYTLQLKGTSIEGTVGDILGLAIQFILPPAPYTGITLTIAQICTKISEEFDTTTQGMLVFDDLRQDVNTTVEVDRVNNKVKIKEGFFQVDQVNYDLNGWTGRYGKPIELSLALHLSTMAPDFVYDFCMNNDLQTEVHIGSIERDYKVKYYFQTADGTILDKEKVNKAYEKLKTAVGVDEYYTGTNWRTAYNEGKDVSLFSGDGNIEFPYVPIQMLDDLNTVSFGYFENSNEHSLDNNNNLHVSEYIGVVDSEGKPVSFYDDKGNAKEIIFNVKDVTVDSNGRFNKTPICMEGKLDGVNIFLGDEKIYVDTINIDEMIKKDLYFYIQETKEGITSDFKINAIGLSMNELITRINNGTFSSDDSVYEDLGFLMNQIDKIIYDIKKYTNDKKDAPEELKDLCSKFTAVHRENYDKWYTTSGGYYSEKFDSIINDENMKAEERVKKLEELRKQCKDDYNIIQEAVILLMDDSNEILDDCGGISISTLKLLHSFFNNEADEIETYEPYIKYVKNHWYKDVYFVDRNNINSSEGVYNFNKDEDGPATTKREEYNPEGLAADDETLNKLKEEGNIYVEMTGNFIEQISQPEFVQDEPWHYMVKNWLTNGYFFIYDGTIETAKEIESAREYLKILGYNPENPLLVDYDNTGLLTDKDNKSIDTATVDEIEAKAKELNDKLAKADYTYEDNNGENKTRKYRVRLQKINFAKKSSLAAFSILEGVHTVDGERVYQDLKNFMIELGYFSEGDFETIESSVLSWMIPDYTPDEWPDGRYEKKNDKYGTYIRSKSSIQAEKEKENGNENQDKESQNQNDQSGNGTTGNSNSNSSSTQGFEKDLDVIAPEQCIVINIEKGNTSDCITIKFTSQNKVKDMTMKIKGIKLNEDIEENKTIEKGTTIGKTTEDDIQLLMRDSKKAIINNIEDYMKAPKKNKSGGLKGTEYDFFYFTYYESGKWCEEGNGPASVGACRPGIEHGVGICQWTTITNGLNNIQKLCGKLYELDNDLCKELKKYADMDSTILINEYALPLGNSVLEKDFQNICSDVQNRDKFLALQMQIAMEEKYDIFEDLGLSWIKNRPLVVQGTLGSLVNWGPYLGWEDNINESMSDEDIIINLLKYACTLNSTVGSLNTRWNSQAKAAIDILNGDLDAEQLLEVIGYGTNYSTSGDYTNFLSTR